VEVGVFSQEVKVNKPQTSSVRANKEVDFIMLLVDMTQQYTTKNKKDLSKQDYRLVNLLTSQKGAASFNAFCLQ